MAVVIVERLSATCTIFKKPCIYSAIAFVFEGARISNDGFDKYNKNKIKDKQKGHDQARNKKQKSS